jgi:hypothetical protein
MNDFLSALNNVNIETGRNKNIIRSERKCTNCSKADIEDEKHFVVDIYRISCVLAAKNIPQ